MPPQDTQNQPPQVPPAAPAAPQPTATPIVNPAIASAPAQVAPANAQKEKTISLVFGILSLVGLVAGFFLGYAALLFAFLGIVGAQRAKKINYTAGLAVGAIGATLNLIAYVLAITVLKK